MQNVPASPSIDTKSLSPSMTTHARGRIEVLALELAQTHKLSDDTTRGNP
jgi:hypothetical protein